MPSIQSYLSCALAENPFSRRLLHGRYNHWTAPVEVVRERVERAMGKAKLPSGVAVHQLETDAIRGEWVVPRGAPRDRVLMYLHGGGYVIGSCKSSRHLVSKIVQSSGIAALSVEYRLTPEHPFPAAVDDAVSAYQWLLQQGYPSSSIAFVGDSAGGGLSLSATLALRDQGIVLPTAVVCLSPFTDACGHGESMSTRAKKDPLVSRSAWEWFMRHYRANHDPTTPLLSPLYGDLHGFPPLMIHVGDHEIMRDDSTRFAARALSAGVEVHLKVWSNMWHVFPALAKVLPEARQALAEMGAFLDSRVAKRRLDRAFAW